MAFPVDIAFVQRAELKIGMLLPLGYVVRICRLNGGSVKVGTDSFDLYPIFDDTDKRRLKRTCNDIVRETASAREWSGFPSDALAIGDNGCGDKLVLLPGDSGRFSETVFWWDHETGEINTAADDFEDLEDC
jgi:hypothetical protein